MSIAATTMRPAPVEKSGPEWKLWPKSASRVQKAPSAGLLQNGKPMPSLPSEVNQNGRRLFGINGAAAFIRTAPECILHFIIDSHEIQHGVKGFPGLEKNGEIRYDNMNRFRSSRVNRKDVSGMRLPWKDMCSGMRAMRMCRRPGPAAQNLRRTAAAQSDCFLKTRKGVCHI